MRQERVKPQMQSKTHTKIPSRNRQESKIQVHTVLQKERRAGRIQTQMAREDGTLSMKILQTACGSGVGILFVVRLVRELGAGGRRVERHVEGKM